MSSQKKRTYNKKEKMETIRSATVELLPKRGYMDLTTKEIAERAGVAIGLLYKYFPAGKVEIIKSIAETIANESVGKVIPSDEYFEKSTDVDIRNIVRNGLVRAVSSHRADRAMIIAIEMAYLSDPEVFGFYALDNYANFDNLASEWFINLVSERLNKRIDEVYAKFLIDIVDAAIHRHVVLIPSFPTDEEFANYLTDIILDLLSCQDSI